MGNLEIWKGIKGYETLYEVSNFGNVRSLKGHNNFDRIKLLAQHTSKKANYKCVTLYDRKGDRKTYKVHRLVAETFIPNTQNLPVINHKDENTLNNHVDNLEWCTVQYNIVYGTALQKASAKRSKGVAFYNKDGMLVHQFDSVLAAGNYFKVKPQNIARVARGVRGSFHGMTVKYIEKH